MIYLGINIKEYRLKRGYTQEQLAYELGVSSQTVSRWDMQRYVVQRKEKLFLSQLIILKWEKEYYHIEKCWKNIRMMCIFNLV